MQARAKRLKNWDLEPMRHLKTNEGGGDPLPVVSNGSRSFFFAATRTPAR